MTSPDRLPELAAQARADLDPERYRTLQPPKPTPPNQCAVVMIVRINVAAAETIDYREAVLFALGEVRYYGHKPEGIAEARVTDDMGVDRCVCKVNAETGEVVP